VPFAGDSARDRIRIEWLRRGASPTVTIMGGGGRGISTPDEEMWEITVGKNPLRSPT
jgi:hypothetical protein